MIMIKTSEEVDRLLYSNRIVASVLRTLMGQAKPGVTTLFLNNLAEELTSFIKGAKPAFKGYRGFPFSLCTSVNNQVVHGFPSSTPLKDGDVLSMDFGVLCGGYYGDSAVTIYVGGNSPPAVKKLLDTTEKALYGGISKAIAGNTLNDISGIIQKTAEDAGFSVVRNFGGHGIGRDLHEDPFIPNYIDGSLNNCLLKEGMVVAIEPMVNMGAYGVSTEEDGWTVVTTDGQLSAHFEHTIAITKGDPIILSRR